MLRFSPYSFMLFMLFMVKFFCPAREMSPRASLQKLRLFPLQKLAMFAMVLPVTPLFYGQGFP